MINIRMHRLQNFRFLKKTKNLFFLIKCCFLCVVCGDVWHVLARFSQLNSHTWGVCMVLYCLLDLFNLQNHNQRRLKSKSQNVLNATQDERKNVHSLGWKN